MTHNHKKFTKPKLDLRSNNRKPYSYQMDDNLKPPTSSRNEWYYFFPDENGDSAQYMSVESENGANDLHTWDLDVSGLSAIAMYNWHVSPNLELMKAGAELMTIIDASGNKIWEVEYRGLFEQKLISGELQGPGFDEQINGYWATDQFKWQNDPEECNDLGEGLCGPRIHHDQWIVPKYSLSAGEGVDSYIIGGDWMNYQHDADCVLSGTGYSSTHGPVGIWWITPTNKGTCCPAGVCNGCDFTIDWEWYMQDHYIQNTNPTLPDNGACYDQGGDPSPNYYNGSINDYPNKIDLNVSHIYGGGLSDFCHFNTVHYDYYNNHIVVSCRYLHEYYVIDVDTKEIVFRCCSPEQYGADNYLIDTSADANFPPGSELRTRHQHGPIVIPPGYENEGDIIVFSNLAYNTGYPSYSSRSAVIKVTPNYTLEVDSSGNNRYSISNYSVLSSISGINDYDNYFPGSFFSTQMAGVMPLPNGGVAISSAPYFFIPPMIPSGMWVFEVENPWTNPTMTYSYESDTFFTVDGRTMVYTRGCTDPEADNFNEATWYGLVIDDGSCSCTLGDLNGDGGFNVLDIVILANCVLANNCADLEYGCAGDLNGDGGFNVLDIVTLASCILANNCGVDANGNSDLDTKEAYAPPPEMTREEQNKTLKEIIDGPQDIQSINDMLNEKVPPHIINGGR